MMCAHVWWVASMTLVQTQLANGAILLGRRPHATGCCVQLLAWGRRGAHRLRSGHEHLRDKLFSGLQSNLAGVGAFGTGYPRIGLIILLLLSCLFIIPVRMSCRENAASMHMLHTLILPWSQMDTAHMTTQPSTRPPGRATTKIRSCGNNQTVRAYFWRGGVQTFSANFRICSCFITQ